MATEKIELWLLSSPAHIFYLTNFQHRFPEEREGVALLNRKTNKISLLVPAMYQDQCLGIFPTVTPLITPNRQTFLKTIANHLKDKIVGFESKDLRYGEFEKLSSSTQKMVPISDKLDSVRNSKTAYEITLLRQVEHITEQALETVLPQIFPVQTEKAIARLLDQAMETIGADGTAFPTIVASGTNSAIPHYQPTSKKIESGEILLIDMGAKKNGYCGDLTRTYFIGKASKKFVTTFNLVLKAQQAALTVIKSGIKVVKVDQAVRQVFRNTNQLPYFLHSTGHGVGIDIHETPKISHLSKEILKPGMVLTIEPGLYYPKWGGIRIEDMVVVTESGYELISRSSYDWQLPSLLH